MLTQHLKSRAREAWEAARPHLKETGDRLQNVMDGLEEELATLMRLLCGTLPALDLVQTPVDVLLSCARHGLMLRKESPWCREIPEDLFVHYVLYPRINTEALTDCRPFFYDLVEPLVRGKTALQAALEVNLWCASHMTYESTDDRTLDPLSAYACGKGRCGEESTFAVSVLRALGIPARQVYAIWWSHCDDNHAWVEFYDGSQWRYFGACEPEPTADRGWFTAASRRAMAICSRRFWDYRTGGLAAETLLGLQGCCILDNQTMRYAETLPLEVRFPKAGGTLRVYVLNMASLRLLTELPAGEGTTVHLELGRGTCLLEAELAGRFAWKLVNLEAPCLWMADPELTEPPEGQWDLDFLAPVSGGGMSPLSDRERELRSDLLAQSESRRRQRLAEITPQVSSRTPCSQAIAQAGAHGKDLLNFARTYGEAAWDLLVTLSKKDWRDAPVDVLERFLREAPGVAPRIAHEKLVFWPDAVRQHLPQTVAPEDLWEQLETRDTPCRQYPSLWPDPVSVLTLGLGDRRSRAVLFAAALELRGIPVEPGMEEDRPRYLWQGVWQVPGKEKTGVLEFSGTRGENYGVTWSLSRWEHGWHLLNLAGESETRHLLPLGQYLLVVTTRIPSGDQLARFYIFRHQGPTKISVRRRKPTREQMLTRYPVCLPQADSGLHLRLYLEPGTEPTEHALNELLETAHLLGRGECLQLFVPEETCWIHPTIQKVLAAYPEARRVTANFGDPDMESLARSLYQEPGVWPLLLVTDGAFSYYCSSGYSVGAVPMALDLMTSLIKEAENKQNG